MTIVNACFRSPDRQRGGKPYVITHPINVTSTSPRIQPRSSSTPNENNNIQRNYGYGNHQRNNTIQRNGDSNLSHHKITPNHNGTHKTFEEKYLTPQSTTISDQYRFETDKRDGHVVCCDHSGQSLPLNGFRSSMLWNDSGISTSENDCSDVLPTFPENRYQKSLSKTCILTKSEACNVIKKKLNESPNGLMKICLDVSRYAPNEIVIKLVDRKLHVEGKHFEESELGDDSCYFHRYFPIPDGTLPGDISSRITPNGVLTIRAQTHVYKLDEITPTRHARFPSDGSSSSETITTSSHAPTRSSSSNHSQRLHSQSSSENRRSFYDNIDLNASSTRSSTTNSTATTAASAPHERHVSFKSTPDECEFIEINNDHYQLEIDVRGYSPEDLRVKVIAKDLIIEGKRKCDVQTPDGRQVQTSEFKKTFRLPSGINIDTMCSRVTSKGVLKVEVWKSISEINKDFIIPK